MSLFPSLRPTEWERTESEGQQSLTPQSPALNAELPAPPSSPWKQKGGLPQPHSPTAPQRGGEGPPDPEGSDPVWSPTLICHIPHICRS